MAEYEDKFVVINKKRVVELNECTPQDKDSLVVHEHPVALNLESALKLFKDSYESDVGKPLDQKYYVVNQDESYAKNVIRFILDNETAKENKNA